MEKRQETKTQFLTILFFLIISGIFTSCNSSDLKTQKVEKPEVVKKANTFLDAWHLAASEANYTNYFGKMDSISVFIGTDAGENWTKKEFENFSKPYFDKGKAWSFKAIERNIYMNEDATVIWFDELLSTWMGLCRGSGVLTMKNNELVLKHYVLSVTIPNDDIQKLITIKKEKDSLFAKKLTSQK
ncbi:MAG: nuclear transport factor 2 family protein [Flavobacteriaceae bacterium]|nr:nuclear transport factor 2 family protein [Flavobacteriaceae bacterium]